VIRSQTLGKIQLWHVPDLKLQGEFSFQSPDEIHNPADAYSGGLSISPNGHTVLTTGTKFGDGLKGELWVWDVQKKMLLRKIKTDKDLWGFTQFKDVIWLPDNRHIVFGTRTKLVLLNIETGKVEKERTDPDAPQFKAGPFSSALRPLRVSSDGRWLAVISTHTGKLLIIDVNTFAVAPPGGVQWWKNVTANTPKPLIAPNVKAALSPHGRLMAFGANSVTSNGVSIWNVSQNREVVRLYLLGGDSQSTTLDWIAITPEGYYAASPAGEKRLRWRDGNTFWSIARSHAHFFRPDIVAKALQSH
jgi:hypothetical protein